MTLRERLSGIPADAWWGYAIVAAFGAWFVSCVLVGPHLFLFASVCLIVPLLVITVLALAYQLAVCRPRRAKVLPLVLVLGCVAVLFGAPGVTVDLHLIGCVYWAGGPNALNDWAQDVINEQNAARESGKAESPVSKGFPGLRGWVSVDGPLQIEHGGGHFHYGILVYPKGKRPPAAWWQRAVGWPPEVVIYQEH
ncbi:unnamed protein product [Gemmata massiliana]|uniref:Uncharacterized protein n=1 Tax=Gemmata massiliana TaxID=1210884 RepID=A0A6P2DIG2_9BACT|nr:hypothetical protein [Gemmata massiliana]VTS01164.1 unnamed protein product [Gemmata massiliana]